LEATAMLDEVHRQGAAAARRGLTLWDSPYLHAEAMPAHTGEPIADWQEKASAWEGGWYAATRDRARAHASMAAALIRAQLAGAQVEQAYSKADIFCFSDPATIADRSVGSPSIASSYSGAP
jgi:hypothetical protein